ncbi:right-handed parallel beta-helix repeat-containing protein [Hymenobacter sp. J193]|uniref:beta strand repeat-containing protein n=1 Tax=Hymenobacter sp. J193 TaxID=2898429 RepID=UPI00215115A5|nr:T9SS type A sorting domain-containing protein [Hymenobacter sp. J193]MCR5888166.1 right-handed parallel beta-helix repeat-containing protein [Hymenobacter sp. J193]
MLGLNARAQTTCTNTSNLDFTSATYTGNWVNRAATAVPVTSERTTVSTGALATGNGSASLAVDDSFGSDLLSWDTDYSNTSTNISTITFTFSRPVTNVRISVADIDRANAGNTSGFVDRVTFAGANNGTAVTPTLAKSGTTQGQASVSLNTNVATGVNTNATALNSIVTATYASPITTLTLTYDGNATNSANPSAQAIAIQQITFCATTPTAVNNTASVSYKSTAAIDILANDLPDQPLDYSKVDLQPSVAGIQSTYTDAGTGIVYTANTTTGTITFSNPNNRVGTNINTLTYTVADATGLTSNQATLVLSLTNSAPTVAAASSTLASSAGRTLLTAFSATDADGAGTIATYNFTVPTTTLGSFYTAATGGSALTPGTTQALTSANTLYFDPNGSGNGTFTFNYTATDNGNPAQTSVAAVYTLTISNGAPSAAAVTASVVNNGTRQLLPAFSATDADGNVIATYTFTVPAVTNGRFYTVAAGGSALTAGSVQNRPANGTLYYVPATGNATATVTTFTYTATDNGSPAATSGNATYSININQAPVAAAKTSTLFSNAGRTQLQAFSATDVNGNGTVTGYTISLPASNSYGTFYRGATGTTALTGPQTFTATEANTLYFEPSGSGNTGTLNLTYTATDGTSTSAAVAYNVTVSAAPVTLSGRVFEDVNYGGGSGVDYATANASAAASGFAVTQTGAGATDRIGRAGVRVELYRLSSGSYVFDQATTTSTVGVSGATINGLYSFTNLEANASYTVRMVLNSATTSVRGGTGLLGVPTYVGAGTTATERVGGNNPALADANANITNLALSALSNAQVQYQLTTGIGGSVTSSVDFGLSFDVIVNNNNSGYGSLRQFMTNAVALANTNLDQRPFNNYGTPLGQDFAAGEETSIFMIPGGTVRPGLRSGLTSQLRNSVGNVATTGDRRALITVDTALPTLSTTNTVVDGTTQTTLLDSNTGLIGTGGTVGRQEKLLAQVERPEIEIVQTLAGATTFTVSASNNTLRGFSIHGGDRNIEATGNTTNGFLAEGLLVGINAFTLAAPTNPNNPTNTDALYLMNNSGTVRNSIIAYAGNSGLKYSNGRGLPGSGYTITQNEFVENGRITAGGDALSFGDVSTFPGAGPLLITENLIRLSNSSGIQFEIGSVSDNIMRDNTIADNGEGGLGGSSRLEGSGIHYLARNATVTSTNSDLIEQNLITSNQSSGIVINRGQTRVRISQNAIYDNGSRTDAGAKGLISIDFTAANRHVGGVADYGQGDGVTPNDGLINSLNGTTYAGQPNAGMDYPVITNIAKTSAGKLQVTGYVGSTSGQSLFGGATIEIYSANNVDANQNGPTVVNGTDNVAHGEAQTYIGTLTAAANGTFDVVLDNVAADIQVGDNITATAYLPAYGTSEAGVNKVSTFIVLPVELTSFTAKAVGMDVELQWRTASEKNNDHFVVERSYDGKYFSALGQVAGHGSTLNANSYSYTDRGVGQHAGSVYYRLKQVDTDGTFHRSQVQTLRLGAQGLAGSVTLYPNPSTTQTTTLDLRNLPTGAYQAMVVDMTGRTLRSLAVAGGTQADLGLQGMPAGTYTVLIRGNQTHLNLKLVKKN